MCPKNIEDTVSRLLAAEVPGLAHGLHQAAVHTLGHRSLDALLGCSLCLLPGLHRCLCHLPGEHVTEVRDLLNVRTSHRNKGLADCQVGQ